MALYTEWELNILSDNIDTINSVINKHQIDIYEPGKQEIQDVTSIILDYIKQNKRKIDSSKVE